MDEQVYALSFLFVVTMEQRLRYGRVLDDQGRLITDLQMLIAEINAGRWPARRGEK